MKAMTAIGAVIATIWCSGSWASDDEWKLGEHVVDPRWETLLVDSTQRFEGPITLVFSREDFLRMEGAEFDQVIELDQVRDGHKRATTIQLKRYRMHHDPELAKTSQRRFFYGFQPGLAISIAVDPEGSRITGTLADTTGSYEITAFPDRLATLKSLHDDYQVVDFQCGVEGPDAAAKAAMPKYPSRAIADKDLPQTLGTLYDAPIAYEYDAEWLAGKGGSTATAQTWIEDVVTAMNTYYPNDLDTVLTIATIITPGGPGHPDFGAAGGASSAGLNEVSNHWVNFHSGVSRVFTAFLSGKSIPALSFSGIATVFGTNTYCSASFGNSLNGIGSSLSASFMGPFLGHEIGHNFGSFHTHCEDLGPGGAFVDQCFNAEGAGCYQGTTSCPAGGCGTVMSYCHFPESSGGPVGNVSFSNPCFICDSPPRFHPLIQGKLEPMIISEAPSCILDVASSGEPPIAESFTQAFASGAVVVTVSATETDGDTVTFAVGSSPSNGSLGSFSAGSRNGNVVTSTVTYTPGGGFEGVDSFTFTATDADGSSEGDVEVRVGVYGSGFED